MQNSSAKTPRKSSDWMMMTSAASTKLPSTTKPSASLSAGVTVSYNLPFISECYGTWTLTAGYTFYYLGDGTSDFNTAERGGAVRDFSEHEHVFSGGLMVAF
jgi:hypothetical protein